MAKKTTKEKKLRRKKSQEENVKRENTVFDVFSLLQNSPLETKPEVGDFLKTYVKDIRVLVSHSKIYLYPVMSYEISKVFIDFLDGHQIIADVKKQPREYFLYFKTDEVEMKEKERKMVVLFVQKLQELSFIQ